MNFADCGLHIQGSHTDARFNAICGLLRVMVWGESWFLKTLRYQKKGELTSQIWSASIFLWKIIWHVCIDAGFLRLLQFTFFLSNPLQWDVWILDLKDLALCWILQIWFWLQAEHKFLFRHLSETILILSWVFSCCW